MAFIILVLFTSNSEAVFHLIPSYVWKGSAFRLGARIKQAGDCGKSPFLRPSIGC